MTTEFHKAGQRDGQWGRESVSGRRSAKWLVFARKRLPTPWLLTSAWLTLASCGCPRPESPASRPDAAAETTAPLRLIVVDDPGLAGAIERQWQARAEGVLEVRQVTSADAVDRRKKRLAGDAVIFPSGLLGELAERELIVPLREDVINGPDLARRDVFDLVRQCEMVWGDKVYAVPFGSPQLTVFYRRDLFEKLGLEPPNSWAEYQEVGTRLANRAKLGDLVPADVTAWHGILEPLGPGWGGQVLLARAAGYARHRNYFSTLFDTDTMEPLIATAPFARALDELVAAAKLGPPESVTYTPAEVKREFLAGRCGLALTWPSRAASRDERSGKRGQPVALGIAALPGSDQVFHPKERQWRPRDRAESGAVPLLCAAGRLGAVTKSSTQPQAACQLLLRLSGAEWSEQISPHSPATTLYRSSQLRAVSAWFDEGFESAVVQQYADLVKQTQRSPLWLYAVRLPGRERYLAALDGAVQQAVRGEKPSAECLQAAAEQWRKITAELGVQSQAKAYWRSLGIEP